MVDVKSASPGLLLPSLDMCVMKFVICFSELICFLCSLVICLFPAFASVIHLFVSSVYGGD